MANPYGKMFVDALGGDPIGITPQNIAVPQAAPQQPHMSRGQMILGILADIAAGAAGRAGPFAAMQQQKQQQAAEEAQWTRRQGSELEQYRQKLEMEHDPRYAKPQNDDQFTRYLIAAGISPDSDAGRALFLKRVQTMADPPHYSVDPSTGAMIMVGGGGPAPAPAAAPRQPRVFTTLPHGAVPVTGGPTPPASGGFRQ